ncbi:hypothetical protein [Methylobacterium sp. 88A]|uniref:hypothetical protein n=1 Tax=Methylobacterium sp. 88A TaxID=1131813 RepID=UPI0012F626E4|nr:hypothetical protein [Methylobacterium sp. 88A]
MALYFTNRRLHQMFCDIKPHLNSSKRKDFVGRLNSPSVDQSLPAEIELALIWALAQTGDIDVEPEWLTEIKRPDAYTETLIPGYPAVVEITAHSNGRMAFEDPMVKSATRISEFADTVERKFSEKLRFCFSCLRIYRNNTFERLPKARQNYKISQHGKNQIRRWIEVGEDRLEYLQFEDGEVECQIRYTIPARIPMRQRVWTTAPPETYDLVDNPLFEALDRKRKQLSGTPDGIARIIFIADAGSDLLRKIDSSSMRDWSNPKTGSQIIENFLLKRKLDIDAVVVFTPHRSTESPFGIPAILNQSKVQWLTKIFTSSEFSADLSGLENIRRALPNPKREGYQARSIGQQYHTSKIRTRLYRGYRIVSDMKSMKFSISSKALFDLLSGMPMDEILRDAIPEQIPALRDRGYTINDIKFESKGLDSDDDHIVITLAPDLSNTPFSID